MNRRTLAVPAAALAAAAFASPAAASTLHAGTIAAPGEAPRHCEARLAPAGARGVTTTRVSAPGRGFVSARLNAASGDWDVAVFDARSKRRVAASSGFAAAEVADGFISGARTLVVQACRRDSDARTAKLRVGFTALPKVAKGEKVQVLEVAAATPSERNRLAALGLDMTEHGDEHGAGVVVYSAAELRKLTAAGFTYKVEVADLIAQSRKDRRAERAYAARTAESPLPSGRDGYRDLAGFNSEMRDLAAQYPNLVRGLTLPHTSLEGRTVHGIEITPNVNVLGDGKPVFVQLGVHHAREWPSAEYPMEFAIELIKGYGTDPKITDLLDRTRVIVVPVVNVDGYSLSRSAPDDSNSGFAYKRRNCRITDGALPAPGECGLTANRNRGTDPNRNYGGFWGGQGASTSPTSDTYRGASPFSEPEVQNVRELVASRQVTTLITNHTSGRLILRPPGVRALGPAKDEETYKAFGDAMAKHNGYTSQYGYQLYDTNGTTEDWTYAATGGYGFTYEHNTAFHPAYQTVVDGYRGTGEGDGARGNRAAYFEALEHTAESANHGVIVGEAPAGHRLSLTKTFDMQTVPVIKADGTTGAPLTYTDTLSSTLDVPAGRSFEWHVNPSTRPIIPGGREKTGEPTPALRFTQTVPPTVPGNRVGQLAPLSRAEHPFTVEAEHDNALAVVEITTNSAQQNLDGYLYRVRADGSRLLIGSSANPAALTERFETMHVDQPGNYVLVVENVSALPLYTASITFQGPQPAEAYTLTCFNPDGHQVGQAVPVFVDRGERVTVDPCRPSER